MLVHTLQMFKQWSSFFLQIIDPVIIDTPEILEMNVFAPIVFDHLLLLVDDRLFL